MREVRPVSEDELDPFVLAARRVLNVPEVAAAPVHEPEYSLLTRNDGPGSARADDRMSLGVEQDVGASTAGLVVRPRSELARAVHLNRASAAFGLGKGREGTTDSDDPGIRVVIGGRAGGERRRCT